MDARVYADMAAHAGEWLASRTPHSYRLDRDDLPETSSPAVYVVEDRQQRVLYVGSTRRPVGRRMAEHLSNPTKSVSWHSVVLFLLKEETPESELGRIEGVVGFDLSPSMSQRHPSEWLR